jgi:hypothetical protein
MRCPPHPLHVDAVEQHRQLGGVHLDRAAVAREARCAKTTKLEPFVIENEAATIPKKNFAAVAAAPQKDEQMPGEEIHSPLPANDATQPVVPAAEIHGLNGEIDPNTRRKCQHGYRSLQTSAAT